MTRRRRRVARELINPLSFLTPASSEEKTGLMLKFYTALDAVERGLEPDVEEWKQLADACNTVQTIALVFRWVDARKVIPIVDVAIEHMAAAAERFKRGDGMHIDAIGIQALRDVIDIYEGCVENQTQKQMRIAQAETESRVLKVLRSNRAEVIAL